MYAQPYNHDRGNTVMDMNSVPVHFTSWSILPGATTFHCLQIFFRNETFNPWGSSSGKCKLNVVDGIKNVCAGSVCSYVIRSRCYYEVLWSKKVKYLCLCCLQMGSCLPYSWIESVAITLAHYIVDGCNFWNFHTFKTCLRNKFVFPNGLTFFLCPR